MGNPVNTWAISVGKELLAAVSGLVLVLFLVMHLSGNLLLFQGPEVFNAYSARLHAMGILLWAARLGLLAAAITHGVFTVWLFLANRAARTTGYAVRKYMGNTNLVKRTMMYTGLMVLAFVLFHLYDFALADKTGPRSVVAAVSGGQSLGLYGVVWGSFSDPLHSLFYLAAVWAAGLHFSNAVSTIWVTLGVLTEAATAKVNFVARLFGLLIALGFSSIPIYVFIMTHLRGV